MNFIDLGTQYRSHKSSIDQAIQRVLDHGQFIMGPEVSELETKLSAFCGANHSISCASGTDALLLALMALDVGPGDEIILPAFSFFATVEVILLLRATPIFVDIDPSTFNIAPISIKEKLTSRTKAIIAVSLYGQCADFSAINALIIQHGNVAVIEDAAQSFGATHHGRLSCNLSTIGCTSFFPSKPLGCYGDGGACFTNNSELAERMRRMRVHGQASRYYHTEVGINGRLDTIQAAILIEKLLFFDEEIRARRHISALYTERLTDNPHLILPKLQSGNESVYAQFTVASAHRRQLLEGLAKAEIPTAIHYPLPLHKQPASAVDQSLPISEMASEQVFSLPFHPYMNSAEIDKVCTVLLSLTDAI